MFKHACLFIISADSLENKLDQWTKIIFQHLLNTDVQVKFVWQCWTILAAQHDDLTRIELHHCYPQLTVSLLFAVICIWIVKDAHHIWLNAYIVITFSCHFSLSYLFNQRQIVNSSSKKLNFKYPYGNSSNLIENEND